MVKSSLPSEVLHNICEIVLSEPHSSELLNFRLTSRGFNQVAQHAIEQHSLTTLHTELSSHGIAKLRGILQDPRKYSYYRQLAFRMAITGEIATWNAAEFDDRAKTPVGALDLVGVTLYNVLRYVELQRVRSVSLEIVGQVGGESLVCSGRAYNVARLGPIYTRLRHLKITSSAQDLARLMQAGTLQYLAHTGCFINLMTCTINLHATSNNAR